MTKKLFVISAIMFSLAVPGAVTFAKDTAPAATAAADAGTTTDTAKSKKKTKRVKKKALGQEAPAK